MQFPLKIIVIAYSAGVEFIFDINPVFSKQIIDGKLASELVPSRTPQMKLQDLFRDSIREVVPERGVPIADMLQSDRGHSEKKSWAENNKLRASTGIQKVREANAVINKRDSIIDAAESKAKDIITEAESVRIRSKLLKENHELRAELDIYRSAADRNPGFMKAVEQEMRGKETHRVSETSR